MLGGESVKALLGIWFETLSVRAKDRGEVRSLLPQCLDRCAIDWDKDLRNNKHLKFHILSTNTNIEG